VLGAWLSLVGNLGANLPFSRGWLGLLPWFAGSDDVFANASRIVSARLGGSAGAGAGASGAETNSVVSGATTSFSIISSFSFGRGSF